MWPVHNLRICILPKTQPQFSHFRTIQNNGSFTLTFTCYSIQSYKGHTWPKYLFIECKRELWNILRKGWRPQLRFSRNMKPVCIVWRQVSRINILGVNTQLWCENFERLAAARLLVVILFHVVIIVVVADGVKQVKIFLWWLNVGQFLIRPWSWVGWWNFPIDVFIVEVRCSRVFFTLWLVTWWS